MPKKKKYRLEVLLNVKARIKRRAELAVAKAIKQLEAEREKLKELQEEKKKIEKRIRSEKNEMRTKVAGGKARAKDPQVHLNFIRKLEEDLNDCLRRIEDQKEEVKRAEKEVQKRRADYILAAQDLNMMEKHKELWEKKARRELTLEEDKMLGELGNVIHQMTQRGAR